jgi:hypothetical protein
MLLLLLAVSAFWNRVWLTADIKVLDEKDQSPKHLASRDRPPVL